MPVLTFNSHDWNPLFKGLLHDPQATHFRRIMNAIWLYLYLLVSVHRDTGTMLSTMEKISADTGLDVETLSSWLGRLKHKGYVTVDIQGGELLFTVANWKRLPQETKKKSSPRRKERRVSTWKAPAFEPNPLAREIAETFDDKMSLAAYDSLCKRYAEATIRKYFHHVKSLPDDKIKKSRGALMTYLVKTYGESQNDKS